MGVDVDTMKRAIRQEYAEGGYQLDDDAATREIVAKFAESKLFTDEAAINRLARENRNLFEIIRDWISDMAVKLTGTSEEKFIRNAERMYQKALESVGEVADTGAAQQLYVGRNARTADLGKLAQAEQMAEQGADNEAIRQETGWFKGMDGKWRFEIDDSGMKYRHQGDMRQMSDPEYKEYLDLWDKIVARGEATQAEIERFRELDQRYKRAIPEAVYRLNNGEATLQDIISHDELFEAYPELRNVHVQFADINGDRASYNKSKNVITIDNSLRDAPETSIIHEVQHAIQAIEGFTPGTSAEYWANKVDVPSMLERQKTELLNSLSKEDANRYYRYEELNYVMDLLLETGEIGSEDYGRYEEESDKIYKELYPNEWFHKLLDLTKRIENPRTDYFNLYRNTAGEIEARDAASRREMDTEARYLAAPDLGDENTVFADGSGESYSISQITGEKGNYGQGVILDTNIFDGVKPRDWGRVLGKYVYKKLAGKPLTMYDANGNAETVELARKNDRVKKDGAKNSHKVLDKLARYKGDNIKALSTVQLSELLATSKYENSTSEHKHQWMDTNGWDYRKVYLQDKAGNIYEATLNIAKGEDRRILYDINLINKIDKSTGGGVVASTETEGPRSQTPDAFNAYDTTSNENVNSEMQEPRYLPTAEEAANGQASYGRSFNEYAQEARYLPTAEDIERGYVPQSSAEYSSILRRSGQSEPKPRRENRPSRSKGHLRHELLSVFNVPSGSYKPALPS
ncbi:MAG: hypothetical protein J5449_05230 [Oscillospiraceae bacterium]|nr:hypothetical protein [Oscillospiraceae bacterium]